MKQTRNKHNDQSNSNRIPERLRVLYFEAGKDPVERYVENSVPALGELVGGGIEYVWLEDGVVLIVNNEGKLNDLPPNRLLLDPSGCLCDIVVGNCLVTREVNYKYVSLTDADLAKWSRLPKAEGANLSQALAATRAGTLPQELDLRHFDAPACDQWYPGAVVAMTPRLAKKWGPTFVRSTRAWDIVFMSCNGPRTVTSDGHLFDIIVKEPRKKEVEIQMRAHYFGNDVIEYVVVSLHDEGIVNVPGLDLKDVPIFTGSVHGIRRSDAP